MKIVISYWVCAGYNSQTGQKQYVRCSRTDTLITTEQARELNAIYNLPAAPGSMRMSE